jgi:hypothetical protein
MSGTNRGFRHSVAWRRTAFHRGKGITVHPRRGARRKDFRGQQPSEFLAIYYVYERDVQTTVIFCEMIVLLPTFFCEMDVA